MNDLFPVAAPAESVLSRNFRVHPVIGDSMEPALRGGRDFVLAAPVDAFTGDGLYLIDNGLGVDLYRVTNILGGKLRLSRDNPRYGAHDVDRERFNESVLAIVVADVKVRDDRFLMEAMQERGR